MPAKSQSLKRPGECALFGDGHYSGGANKFMRCPEVWYGDRFASIKSAGTQGYRHLGKTNVAFCDGHSESRKERFTNTNAIAKRNIDKYNEISGLKTGFLSEDNSMYDMD
jgi:prepilin-type processing-associated H-X9-DG protein